MDTTLLEIGRVVTTAGVHYHMDADASFHTFVLQAMFRHMRGDWGEVCKEDHESNEIALVSNRRLFSVYECAQRHQYNSDKIYIITEADRSVTTILWPGEY